jgi:hypothetical protein
MRTVYVIKKVSEVTQAQLNACGVRHIDKARKSLDGSKCVLDFPDSIAWDFFMNDTWLTLSEVREILSGSDWTPAENPEGLMSKLASFLGLQ